MMDKLTRKENLQLGKDLNASRIKVLINAGYSVTEVARVMEVSESIVRTVMKGYDIKESE